MLDEHVEHASCCSKLFGIPFVTKSRENKNQTSDTKKITYCMAHQKKEELLARENFFILVLRF